MQRHRTPRKGYKDNRRSLLDIHIYYKYILKLYNFVGFVCTVINISLTVIYISRIHQKTKMKNCATDVE